MKIVSRNASNTHTHLRLLACHLSPPLSHQNDIRIGTHTRTGGIYDLRPATSTMTDKASKANHPRSINHHHSAAASNPIVLHTKKTRKKRKKGATLCRPIHSRNPLRIQQQKNAFHLHHDHSFGDRFFTKPLPSSRNGIQQTVVLRNPIATP